MLGNAGDLLREHVEMALAGSNGNYASVFEAVAGTTAGEAMWKPDDAANGIWDITQHLILSKRWMIDMLEKGQAEPVVWEEQRGSDEEWQETIQLLQTTPEALEACER